MENVTEEKTAGSPREKFTSDKMKNTTMVRLILQMSIPAMLSMLVLSLYNIVDSVFLSRFDVKALDALSIAFPMQQFMIAFSVGVAIGTNAYVARKLGQKKYKEATLTAQTGLFLSMCCSLMFVVIAFTLSRPFVSAFSSDPTTIEYGVTYLTIVMSLSMASFVDVLCARVLQATGNMLVPMITQIVGAVVNIALDPIFIFVADLGVTGAAIATVAGQVASMSIGLLVFRFKKHDVNLFFDKSFRLKGKIVKGILKIGLPTIVMNSVSAFVTVVLNAILKAYQSAITVLGVYFKLQSFVFM
ncbi:MAG: MATE family efflux transporter, partial [Clostridia bacterium]|nr:MATE family efflux transporter [Clostridia bacterium]